MMKKIWVFLSLILLICSCSKKPVYTEAPFNGRDIRIELRGMPEKKPVFFTFHSGKKGINYFVLKLDGTVQSYFDACSRCYPKKLGYRLDKEHVVCRECDITYHISDLKDGIGSCYPLKLEGRIEGESYIIEKNRILEGEKYF